jgi:hypothetical protein
MVALLTERGTQAVAGGVIHDWIEAIFIPNATRQGHSSIRYLQRYCSGGKRCR